MATVATPMGFIPLGKLGGQPACGSTRMIPITSTFASNIFTGDPVRISADGTCVLEDAGNLRVVGVFMGCFFTDATTGPFYRQYWPASQVATDAIAYVLDDPDQLYRMQGDGAVAQILLGSNFTLITTAGSTINGRSRYAFDADANGTITTDPVRLIDFWEGPNSAVGDAFTDVVVKIEYHQYTNVAGAV